MITGGSKFQNKCTRVIQLYWKVCKKRELRNLTRIGDPLEFGDP